MSAKLQSNEEIPFDVCNGAARLAFARARARAPCFRSACNGDEERPRNRVTPLLKIMNGVIDRKGNEDRSNGGDDPRARTRARA